MRNSGLMALCALAVALSACTPAARDEGGSRSVRVVASEPSVVATYLPVPGVRPLKTPTGLSLRIAPGWAVRDKSRHAVWLISDRDGEVTVRRMEGRGDPGYRKNASLEASAIATLFPMKVAGPVDTTLFGEPAAALAASGKTYGRVCVWARGWRVEYHMVGPMDRRRISALRAMLSSVDGTGPAIPVP